MQDKNPYVRTIYRSSCWRLNQKAGSGFLMLNKIIRSCLFYSGTRWCPRCIAFDRRIYCEKEQFGGFLWRTFYYAVKRTLTWVRILWSVWRKKETVCMYTSFVRYIFPTLALSKSGFRVETESRLLSAGFHQLPVSNIKVVLVLLCIRTGENARENSETVVSGRKIRRNFSVADTSHFTSSL